MKTTKNDSTKAEREHTKKCIEFMAEDFRNDCICFMKPERTRAEIVEWLYLNDEAYDTKQDWRKAFLAKLREVLGDE